jgi:hypothetical protein
MARTRACKARPRPSSRNTITRVTPKRGSTVESLRASDTSTEEEMIERRDTPTLHTKHRKSSTRGNLHYTNEKEDSNVKIKQEVDDLQGVNECKASPKRRAQEPTPKASVAKKRKLSPHAIATRITRSKTLPYRNEQSSTESDSESEIEIGTHGTAKTPSINSPLYLLRPYMSFQLSVSGLCGKAYKAAQASMRSALNAAESFEKQCGATSASAHDSPNSSSSEESSERKSQIRRKRGNEKKVYKVVKFGTQKNDDVLPRKQRELNEQTRKRLARETRGKLRRDESRDEDSVSCQPPL